ncbi:hypothetical protein O181_018676 [Austropuccinia psidii MF-1]|uniref:Uncharacterized protein n=1 Tax=Austropuccinia psidii MF-1 TaxID=1389203 RepID=A0A9Q3GT58_9BASI|nr:hypothetical protein [Austropuccinia psidii MF-1]
MTTIIHPNASINHLQSNLRSSSSPSTPSQSSCHQSKVAALNFKAHPTPDLIHSDLSQISSSSVLNYSNHQLVGLDNSKFESQRSRDFQIESYPQHKLLKILARLLDRITTENDHLRRNCRPATPSSELGRRKSRRRDHRPSQSPTVTQFQNSHSFKNHLSSNLTTTSSDPNLSTASRKLLSNPSAILTFHAKLVPEISIEAYLQRILKYCPTPNGVFISTIVYLDRLCQQPPVNSSAMSFTQTLDMLRLVITLEEFKSYAERLLFDGEEEQEEERLVGNNDRLDSSPKKESGIQVEVEFESEAEDDYDNDEGENWRSETTSSSNSSERSSCSTITPHSPNKPIIV